MDTTKKVVEPPKNTPPVTARPQPDHKGQHQAATPSGSQPKPKA